MKKKDNVIDMVMNIVNGIILGTLLTAVIVGLVNWVILRLTDNRNYDSDYLLFLCAYAGAGLCGFITFKATNSNWIIRFILAIITYVIAIGILAFVGLFVLADW